jgi:formylmethanofuran dehydrogenase subunit C
MSVQLDFLPRSPLLADLRNLRPREVCALSGKEIEALQVPLGIGDTALGELCRVTKSSDGKDELVLAGNSAHCAYIGYRMDGGRLVVDGDAGPFVGAEMSAGSLQVLGNAGDCAGAAMNGGRLWIRGNAGDWCGAAQPGQSQGMTGGTLLVDGNVGKEAGSGMRRGLLVIGGDSGKFLGAHLLAGTIFVCGRTDEGAGLGMKRGSLVIGKSVCPLPGFRPAGEADPEWLRIYLAWLGRMELPLPHGWNGEPPDRFTGDHLVTGKGELQVYEIIE